MKTISIEYKGTQYVLEFYSRYKQGQYNVTANRVGKTELLKGNGRKFNDAIESILEKLAGEVFL